MIGVTIGQLMEQAANDQPHKEAFVVSHQRVRLTFEELLLQVIIFFRSDVIVNKYVRLSLGILLMLWQLDAKLKP